MPNILEVLGFLPSTAKRGQPGMVADAFNPNTQEVQRCRLAWVTYGDPVSRNQGRDEKTGKSGTKN